MRIHINGEPRDVEKDLSLSQLVATLGLKAEQVAIELNHTVVRRAVEQAGERAKEDTTWTA